MAVALNVYRKQTEDGEPGARRAPQRLWVGYGSAWLSLEQPQTLSDLLAGISLESSRFKSYHNLSEMVSTRLEPNAAASVEPIVVSFSEMPIMEASSFASTTRDKSFITYIEGHEFVSLYSEEQKVNIVLSDKPNVVTSDRLPIDIEQRLEVLASLPTNWDSYGAFPVERLALEKTRKLLTNLYSLNLTQLPSPFIAPDPEGGLGLEWDFGPRGEVYLEISSKGQITCVLTMGQGSHEQQHTLADDLHGIEQIFKIMRP